MRNILKKKLLNGSSREASFGKWGLEKRDMTNEKGTMMKIMGIQVRRRRIPQREDSRSEDPKVGKTLAQA